MVVSRSVSVYLYTHELSDSVFAMNGNLFSFVKRAAAINDFLLCNSYRLLWHGRFRVRTGVDLAVDNTLRTDESVWAAFLRRGVAVNSQHFRTSFVLATQ